MKRRDARRGSFLDKGRKNKGWVCKHIPKFFIFNFSFLICSGATFGASMFLEPAEGELTLNCPNPIQIRVDTKGKTTNTIDAKIINNPNLPITEISSKNGIFNSYIKKFNTKIRQGKYKGESATYIMGNAGANKGFAGKSIFATIYVTPTEAGEQDLKLYMVPNYNGDDSNISIIKGGTATDLLDTVTNGHYTISEGPCTTTEISKLQTITEITDQNQSRVKIEDLPSLNLNEEIEMQVQTRPKGNTSIQKRIPQISSKIIKSTGKEFRNKIQELFERIILNIIS